MHNTPRKPSRPNPPAKTTESSARKAAAGMRKPLPADGRPEAATKPAQALPPRRTSRAPAPQLDSNPSKSDHRSSAKPVQEPSWKGFDRYAWLRERLTQYALLTRQHRPVGWLLLLWPTYWALWLAAEGPPSIRVGLVFTLGVVVMRSAGCAINDYADRWLDSHVARTAERPLASGKVSPREALGVFGALLLVAAGLVLLTNPKTIVLAAVAAVLAMLYPFTKRRSWVPQFWLGLAFSMAIPMAFTAVTDAWPPPLAWLLVAANTLWAMAYDTYYAMVDRADDLRAGARSTAILFGDLDLVAIAVLQGAFLLAMALVGSRAGLGGVYAGAWLLAAVCSMALWWMARSRVPQACFRAFTHSHWVGFILWAGIVADQAMR